MPPGRVFQAGFTSSRLWLRATVVNTLPQRTRFVWSLYAFVDSAALFVQPGGRGAAQFVAGTSGRAVASARGFPARASCLPFWLEAHAQDVVYLAVENHTGATYLPTDLTTTEDFLAYEQAFFFTKRWSWLLGLYLGSALLNLVLFAFMRDRLHLWYGAYILFGTWFLLMEDGLAAWLLPQPIDLFPNKKWLKILATSGSWEDLFAWLRQYPMVLRAATVSSSKYCLENDRFLIREQVYTVGGSSRASSFYLSQCTRTVARF